MVLAFLLSVAAIAGAVASVTGFGVGSLLTPALAIETGFKVAIAAVSIPHLAATSVRFWALRKKVDSNVLWRFGIASAVGGLIGALLFASAGGPVLTAVFGGLLILAGITGLSGLMERLRLGRMAALLLGGLSGVLGGMVGNQGGIRSAALLGFGLKKENFVATATAIALFVDGARLPIYLWSDGRAMLEIWPLLLWLTIAVVAGTLLGQRLLTRIPEKTFRRIVCSVILLLGVSMMVRAMVA